MKNKYLLIFFCILAHINTSAQKSYEMELANFEQEDERGFTFDVRIRNTNPSEPFGIEAIQWKLTYNTALTNGGAFQNSQLTYVAGTSQMDGSRMIPLSTLFTTDQIVLNWITDNLNVDERTTYLNDGNWRTVGKFRARLRTATTGTTVHNFADVLHNLSFDPSQIGVTWCEVYYDEEGAEGAGWYRASSYHEVITNRIFTNSFEPNMELAGYYMNNGADWATASNWNNSVAADHPAYQQLPGTGNNALIGVPANISGSTNVKVRNIYLKTGGSLTLASGGSLIHNNSGVLATVQRTLPGSSLAWHTISAPLNGMLITGSGFQPGASDDFYLWHEPSPGTWVNYKNQDGGGGTPSFPVANGGNNFATGRGYLVAYNETNPTKTFAGELNAGNVNIALSKSGTKWDYTSGWNLIGNPYASSLDFGALTTAGILAENYAQVYDPTAGGGGGYVQVNTIAPHQGFFVVAANDAVNLAMNTTHQVHGGTFLKNEDVTAQDMFTLKLSNDQYFDITSIFLNTEASSEYDFYDASKLLSFNTSMPQVYALVNGQHKLSINSIPSISESLTIPVSILVPSNGFFTISLTDIAGAFEDQTIVLHDKITNTYHILSDIPVYNFTARTEDSPDRFEIAFTTVGIPETTVSSLLNAYAFANMLYVMNYCDKAIVQLYGLQGQLILNQEIGQGLSSIAIAVPKGSYIVKMISSGETAVKKVVIN